MRNHVRHGAGCIRRISRAPAQHEEEKIGTVGLHCAASARDARRTRAWLPLGWLDRWTRYDCTLSAQLNVAQVIDKPSHRRME